MSQWPLVPSILLSSRANRWLSIPALAATAREAGTDGLDLDLSSRVGLPLNGLTSVNRINLVPETTIPSVWLPRAPRFRSAGSRADQHVDQWVEMAGRLKVRQLLVDREPALRPMGDRDKRPLLLRLQDGVPSGTRVTLVLRPNDLEGTRVHLATITSLRRMAEEWDFDLALDLCGSIDPRWEAEAAIQRVLGRLTLVRLAPSGNDISQNSPQRLTRRSLAYLLDQSFSGTLSLVPSLPWAGSLSAATLERRTRNEADLIAERHQRIFASHPTSSRTPTRQQR